MRAAFLCVLALILTAAAPQPPTHPQHPAHSQPPAHAQRKTTALPQTQAAPVTPLRTPRLKLSLQPPDVTVDPANDASATLILTVPVDGSAPIDNATLDISVPPGVNASTASAPTFPTSQDMVWKILVSIGEKAPPTTKLVATLTYHIKGALPNVDTAVATITQLQPVDLATSVKSVLAPSAGTLDQYNSLGISLLLANSDRRTAYVDGFRVLSPPYVHIDAMSRGDTAAGASASTCPQDTNSPSPPPVWHCKLSIKPGESAVALLTLKTNNEVIPGTYDLILGYAIGPTRSEPAQEIATAQGKITIGVPGVSDVMSLLGVPSFVLLPGALSVVAFVLIFTLGANAPAFDWRSPKYLFFAITLSLGYAVLYPLLVAHIGLLSFDYVHGYNVLDAAVLWVGSIVVGALAAVLGRFVRYRIKQNQAREAADLERRMEPSGNDSALDILQKLARHDHDYRLRTLQAAAPGAGGFMLLLPFGSAPDGKAWATGQGVVGDGAKPLSGQEKQRIQEIHDTVLSTGASSVLWDALNDASIREGVTFEWGAGGPRIITVNEFVPQNNVASLIRFDW
jgi:hypothetical protein